MDISENESNNGWQNIGISYIYAMENIEPKYIATFMGIVRLSFGYKQNKTRPIKTDSIAEYTKTSRASVCRSIKWLAENNHIKIITAKGFNVGGGSKPNSYAPAYPRGIGKIAFKDDVAKVALVIDKTSGAKF